MHDLLPTFSLGAAATLGVAASLVLALSPSAAAPPAASAATAPSTSPTSNGPPANLAELRARGQAGLDELLAQARGHAGDPRWAYAVDTVAAQRYASASGLYWYTELDRAEAEAQRSHRPILALRMLGDLRDDLSCANSRLFRATLYANTEVSAFLRDHFVLYWSSERAVPTITVDFGDGRKLVRTITGNSAHYVLDEDGHVLDVLPGLYAPKVFQDELTMSVALADLVRGRSTAERLAAITAYHTAGIAEAERRWTVVPSLQYLRGVHHLLAAPAAVIAQAATMAKARMEVPDLRTIGVIRPGDLPASETEAWSEIGQALWDPHRGADAAMTVLDPASRALVLAIDRAGPVSRTARDDNFLAQLEQEIVADTAIDELRLRPAIRRQLVAYPADDFATLNGWIYSAVFATPRSDPWLGLLPRAEFTGLPGDGAVMP